MKKKTVLRVALAACFAGAATQAMAEAVIEKPQGAPSAASDPVPGGRGGTLGPSSQAGRALAASAIRLAFDTANKSRSCSSCSRVATTVAPSCLTDGLSRVLNTRSRAIAAMWESSLKGSSRSTPIQSGPKARHHHGGLCRYRRQQQRIIAAAEFWLAGHPDDATSDMRFDDKALARIVDSFGELGILDTEPHGW